MSWFRDLYSRGLLVLDPPYQRRSVWNQAFRDYFVETILLQFPSPAVFLYEEITPEGVATYSVVDGKQRLTTLLEFTAGGFPVSENSTVVEVQGKYFSELPNEVKQSVWTYEMAVEFVPTTDESILKNIFDRINRNVSRLTPQELRHAQYNGVFITTAEDLADWMVQELGTDFPRVAESSRRQMRDVELVTQLLLLIENGPQSFSQADLDAATSERDEDWPGKASVEEQFREVVGVLRSIWDESEISANWRHRFRNQVDFYSLFGAILELKRDHQQLPSVAELMARADEFLDRVNSDEQRAGDLLAQRYWDAVRANSNGASERRTRIAVIKEVITGTPAAA